MKTIAKAGFTPGPWRMETVKTSIGLCHKVGPFPLRRDGQSGWDCIYVDNVYRADDAPELLANARLIAAAPELLAALQATGYADNDCHDPDKCGKPIWNGYLCAPCMARAAIAKATNG